MWNFATMFLLGLLANSIIYYSATLLTKLMDHWDRLENIENCDFVKRLSPAAWTVKSLFTL
jgi:hypothetical protein